MIAQHCRCEAALALADAAQDLVLTWGWRPGDLAPAVRALLSSLDAFYWAYPKTAGCCPSARMCSTTDDGLTRDGRTKRFADALAATGAGVCNPSGIAKTLVEACAVAILDGFAPAGDPAVRLMAAKLAVICEVGHGAQAYDDLVADCRARVGLRRSGGSE
jgi:hypothetical protein